MRHPPRILGFDAAIAQGTRPDTAATALHWRGSVHRLHRRYGPSRAGAACAVLRRSRAPHGNDDRGRPARGWGERQRCQGTSVVGGERAGGPRNPRPVTGAGSNPSPDAERAARGVITPPGGSARPRTWSPAESPASAIQASGGATGASILPPAVMAETTVAPLGSPSGQVVKLTAAPASAGLTVNSLAAPEPRGTRSRGDAALDGCRPGQAAGVLGGVAPAAQPGQRQRSRTHDSPADRFAGPGVHGDPLGEATAP